MPLDKLLASFSNSTGAASPLTGLFGSPGCQGALSGALSGGAMSLLMNKKARKMIGKHALKVGGAAAVAGVGYLAYRQWQKGQGIPAPAGAPALPLTLEDAAGQVQVSDPLQVKMIFAMIGAAGSDGNIDGQELDALMNAIEAAPLDAAGKSELTAALNSPPSVEDIASLVTSPEEASEVYGAALTAIQVDTPAEHMFLRRFAKALQLEPELVKAVHQTIEA